MPVHIHSFLQLVLFQSKIVRMVWLRFPSLCPGSHLPCEHETASLLLPLPCLSFLHHILNKLLSISAHGLHSSTVARLHWHFSPVLLFWSLQSASKVVKSQVQNLILDQKRPLFSFYVLSTVLICSSS